MSKFFVALGAIVVAIVGVVVFAATVTAPVAWAVMLLLGLAHSLDPTVPAFGFVVTWVLVFALRVATIQNVTQPTKKAQAQTWPAQRG